MPRDSKKKSDDAQVARFALAACADGLEAVRLRLSQMPDAVGALNESIAILRDAANVVDPDHPQEKRTVRPGEDDGGA